LEIDKHQEKKGQSVQQAWASPHSSHPLVATPIGSFATCKRGGFVLQRATKPAKELIAQNPPQDDLQTRATSGLVFARQAAAAAYSRRRQQVAASRQQEPGSRARDTTKCVTRYKNGEKCQVCVFRCYGTQSRAASNRRTVNSKSSLPELALLLSA